jgi:hypothetical protein
MQRDPEEPVQVVLIPVLFERFKEWLDRDVDAVVFRIPGMPEDDLVTYAVAPNHFGPRSQVTGTAAQ